jgi:hypothetical protein
MRLYTEYDEYGKMMTGFDSANERAFFGHWQNPEYQENELIMNMSEQEFEEYLNGLNSNDDDQVTDYSLPF